VRRESGIDYEPVIGLEVHAQLSTRSKMFCGCPSVFGAEPNTMVCPVCLGLPGVLPVVNREAVSMAVMLGLALRCRIEATSMFARKNYFYPDCPKNYQISMYEMPLCVDGRVDLATDGESRHIGIERIHLEEDAGKLIHGSGDSSLVDFNRCGIPLVEIVSRPDIRSAAEAAEFLVRLRRILRYLGICDGNMEEGSLRCDVNVSLKEAGSDRLGTKTEIKNLNSFKAVETGIRSEIDRQTEILDKGGRIVQVTNLWDADGKRLVEMRSKEFAHDYRYFPEPDLPVLKIERQLIEKIKSELPELPFDREVRFREEYGLTAYESGVLCAERGVADYYESLVRASGDPKAGSKWVMREVLGELKSAGMEIEEFPLEPDRLAKLIVLVLDETISGPAGRDVFREMVRTGEDAEAAVARLGLRQVSDKGEIESIVDVVLRENPREVKRYREGKTKLLAFFVGQVMKLSGGKANPKVAGDIIRSRLVD